MIKKEFTIFCVDDNEYPEHGEIVVPVGFLCPAVYYDGRNATRKGFISCDGNNEQLSVRHWYRNLPYNWK